MQNNITSSGVQAKKLRIVYFLKSAKKWVVDEHFKLYLLVRNSPLILVVHLNSVLIENSSKLFSI